ncbi:MAG: hypothetical protein H5T84_03520, partial [Thermoleophilia bacterium]|nr:hypothetical protein [Thermoleophilia bacterium]
MTEKIFYCALEKLPARYTDALVVMNHEDERLARALRLAGSGRIYYMPGIGIDLNVYSRSNISTGEVVAVRRELSLAHADHLFVIVAALMPGGQRHARPGRAAGALSTGSPGGKPPDPTSGKPPLARG